MLVDDLVGEFGDRALFDHPAVVGVLNEILSNQSLANEECYGFRYDHTGLKYRVAGEEQKDAAWGPHGGGGIFNFRGNSHIYQMEKGHIHAGLVRVVWELNDVAIDSGGERPPVTRDCLDSQPPPICLERCR